MFPMIRLPTSFRGAIRAAAFFTLTVAALPGFGETAADLSGEWYFDVNSQNGPGHREVLFRQEDQRVIGFIESDSASGRFVGRVDGSNVEFTAVLEFGGEPTAGSAAARECWRYTGVGANRRHYRGT